MQDVTLIGIDLGKHSFTRDHGHHLASRGQRVIACLD
jgi:hypothetical protein